MKCLSWNSDAYGYNKMNIFTCPGRISVDVMIDIKRNYKLAMYNLASVGNHFLGESKVDLKAHEMFQIHKEITEIVSVAKETTGLERDREAIEAFIRVNPDQENRILEVIKGNTLVCHYNIQDSVLVIRLFEKLNTWISLIELSSIVRVTPIEFFTRGQQVRCIAQLYFEASRRDIVMTHRENDYIFFSGGKVEDPISGFWEMLFVLTSTLCIHPL